MLKHCQSSWCKDLGPGNGSGVGDATAQLASTITQQNIKKAFEKQVPFNRGSCSDADSGICADNLSDGQVSPKLERRVSRPVVTGVRPRSKSCCKRFSTDESVMTGDRRSRQMKVRFADQPNTPVTPVTPVIARKPQLPINTNSLARRLGQFADPPSKPPPPYEVACQKLRQLDINKTTLPSTTSRGYYYTLAESQAELQQEIISKPSISNTKSMEELCTAKVKRTNSRLGLTEATVASARLSTFLYDSQETIVAELQSFSQIPQTPRQETIRCRYQDRVITAEPIAKIASSMYNKVTMSKAQPVATVMAETLPRKRVSNESITRPFIDDMSFAVANRRIDVTVLSIDFKGVKVLLVKKTQPGPFGFYISTPDNKKLKGIYISNLSAVGLAPAILVGDRILEVNGESVKGKTLEEVQMLMVNREELILKLAPFKN